MQTSLISQIKHRPAFVFLIVIIIFYLINGIFYLRAQSLTSDESSFLYYAARLAKGHPERVYPQADNSKMPIVVLNLLPRIVEQVLHPGLKKSDNGASDVFAGRYITLFVSVFIILIVYQWSKELYGEPSALLSVFLISFCPNMIANAGLVTTDSYSMLFLAATIYCLWKFCRAPSAKSFILFSACAGISQLAKQSLFHLYVLLPLMFIVYWISNPMPIRRGRLISYLLIFVFINWLVINLGFYFRESNLPIGEYSFSSNLFINLQHLFPSWVPVPFPKAFVTGLDLGKYYDQIGGGDYVLDSHGKVTILGQSSTGSGFWYYYIVSLLFKTPIGSLILICWSLVVLMKQSSYRSFIQNEFFLVAPVVYYLVFMSFFYSSQIGIRQMIFIYPFLYILCGRIISRQNNFYQRTAIIGIGIFLALSVLRYWRNYYPYTNEFITKKELAYRVVGCANLDFKQSKFFNEEYFMTHPEVKPATPVPGTGIFLIELSDYMDIWNLHQYDWINHIKPSGQVAFNSLLITVTEKDLKAVP